MASGVDDNRRRRSDQRFPQTIRPFQVAAETLAEVVKAISERSRLIVLALDKSSGRALVAASVGSPHLPVGASFHLMEDPKLAALLTDPVQQSVSAEGLDFETDVKEAVRGFSYREAFLIPISSGDQHVGWVVIDEPGSARTFDEHERRLLAAAVKQSETLMENAELREQAMTRQRTFEGIAQLGVVLTSTLHLDDAARQVIEYGRILTDLRAFVLLYRPEGAAEFHVLASEGVSGEVARCTLKPIEAAAIDLDRSRLYATEELSAIVPSELFERCEMDGLRHALIAPLATAGGRLRGMLIGLDRRNQELDEEQEVAFRLLVMQAANAIWNAERYEAQSLAQRELSIELARSRTLQEAATAATASSEMDEVARRVLGALRENLQPVSGDVKVVDNDGTHLTLLDAFGLPDAVVARTVQVRITDEAMLGTRAVQHGRIFTDADEWSTPERTAFLQEAGLLGRRYAAIPIRSRGEVLGVLSLAFEDKRPFRREEKSLMQTVADVIGQAFENMRIYRAEHDLAETLQSSLLVMPHKVPGIDFEHIYHSATQAAHVGGDFYDVFEMERERLGVVIGDVSGKGIEAASLTMIARNAIRAYAYDGASPAAVFAKTNDMLWRMSDAETFVTAFFAVLDPASGELSYCAAGHPAPVAVRLHGGTEMLPVSSPFLGAFDSVEYVDEHARLSPGDLLVLYTDGVLEARDSDGAFFGEERLHQAVRGVRTPKEACTQLFRHVQDFAGGELSDDLALFVLALEEAAAH